MKITETRLYQRANPDTLDFTYILVGDAELVLVECEPEEALFWRSGREPYKGQLTHYSFSFGLVKGIGMYLKPIPISRTEKIKEGDWYYNSNSKKILKCDDVEDINQSSRNPNNFKILALSEHFSPQHLQNIVDGTLKEGKVAVECVEEKYLSGGGTVPNDYFIKLNSSNHITLHKIEDEKKTHTRNEIKSILVAWDKESKTPYSYADINGLDKWFEKYVK